MSKLNKKDSESELLKQLVDIADWGWYSEESDFATLRKVLRKLDKLIDNLTE